MKSILLHPGLCFPIIPKTDIDITRSSNGGQHGDTEYIRNIIERMNMKSPRQEVDNKDPI